LELKNTTNILQEQASLETLQAQQEIWQQRQSQGTAWLKVLTDRATTAAGCVDPTEKTARDVARTRDAEESAKAPPPILQQYRYYARVIEAAQQPHQAQRDEILNLQSKVAELVASCNTALAQIAGLQHMPLGGSSHRRTAHLNGDYGLAPDYAAERVPKIAASYWGIFFYNVRDPSGTCRGTLPSS